MRAQPCPTDVPKFDAAVDAAVAEGAGRVVVDAADAGQAISQLAESGESAWEIGRIVEGFAPVAFL